ncbi:MAG TPA: hypothetical protein VFT74_16465 [Isosphaeraceae bacterium]|nr:hypothetical protein [Isosphaeraceae bacterium]
MIAPLLMTGVLLVITQDGGTFLLDGGTFTIRFPHQPERKTVLLPATDQRNIASIVYRVEDHFLDYSLTHQVCGQDVPTAAARVVLQTARDQLVSQVSGTLVSSREITLDRTLALEFEVEYLDSERHKKRLAERTCLADGRFYQIMVVGNPTLMKSDDGSTAFLQSFTLVRPDKE